MKDWAAAQFSHGDGGSEPVADALTGLDPSWVVLSRVRIDLPPGGIALDLLLIDRSRGVALIGAETASVDRFRTYLEHGEFETFFPGYLPVVAIPAGIDYPADLTDALADAFAGVPSLTINDGNWADALANVLGATDRTPPPSDPGLRADPSIRPERRTGPRDPVLWGAACLAVITMIVAAVALTRTESSDQSRAALVHRLEATLPPPSNGPQPQVDGGADTSPDLPAASPVPAAAPPGPAASPPSSDATTAADEGTSAPPTVVRPKPRHGVPGDDMKLPRRHDGPPIDASDLPPPDPADAH